MRLSRQWRLERRAGELLIHGGQDAIFTIDLNDGHETFFADLDHDRLFSAGELSAQDRVVLEQLMSATVVQPVLAPAGDLPVVKVVGDQRLTFSEATWRSTENDDYDLLVLVRTTGTYRDFLVAHDYEEIRKPHLFVDMAFHHTVSFGPLVFPGSTSCVACLQGRISERWGDEVPPPDALGIGELSGIAREWLALEVKNILSNQDYSLVNKTVVLDMSTRSMRTNKLLTVPLCSYCRRDEPLLTGRIDGLAISERSYPC